MGMSNKNEGGNKAPVDAFISFNMKDGNFYRKERGGDREKIGSKFKFIIVDDGLSVIGGYEHSSEKRISSNFVNKNRGEFTVWLYPKAGSRRKLAEGKWKLIKDNVPSYCKYTRVIFIYIPTEKRFAILRLHGTSLMAFSQHLKDTDDRYSAEGRFFNITKTEKQENGYYAPVFVSRPLEEEKKKEAELIELCTAFDEEEIQPYIKIVASSDSVQEEETVNESAPVEEPEPEEADVDDLPF